MNGVTQPKTPPKFLVMFGRNALLVGVPVISHGAAAGSALATEYGTTVSRTASSEVRRTTSVDYDLGVQSWSEVGTE